MEKARAFLSSRGCALSACRMTHQLRCGTRMLSRTRTTYPRGMLLGCLVSPQSCPCNQDSAFICSGQWDLHWLSISAVFTTSCLMLRLWSFRAGRNEDLIIFAVPWCCEAACALLVSMTNTSIVTLAFGNLKLFMYHRSLPQHSRKAQSSNPTLFVHAPFLVFCCSHRKFFLKHTHTHTPLPLPCPTTGHPPSSLLFLPYLQPTPHQAMAVEPTSHIVPL